MQKKLAGLVAGVTFGMGLAISQMISQDKVLSFLDFFGNWDPSLAFVMGGAVAVSALLFRFVLRRPQPLLDGKFHLSDGIGLDKRLAIGSALFGIGWGVGGYCPGPGLAALSLGRIEPVIFVAAMIAGSLACKWLATNVTNENG
jgi:uncharacterized protein